jgi:hypothetical protein
MREGTTSRVMAADKPYGEFYDFYSVSPEYFGYTVVFSRCLYLSHISAIVAALLLTKHPKILTWIPGRIKGVLLHNSSQPRPIAYPLKIVGCAAVVGRPERDTALVSIQCHKFLMLLIPCLFLQLIYETKNALNKI